MKRSFVLIAAALLAAALCWGSPQGGELVLPGVDPTGVEITYWHQFTRFQQETLEALVEEFNQTNQWNIKVTAEFGGRYDDLYNKMVTAIAAGSVPNLVAAYQNEAAAYQASGALVDINDYIDDPEWGLGDERSDYFEGFLQQDVNAQFGGERLGFPPNRSLELLYYNADWLEQMGFGGPPQDWDEFYRMCKKATNPGENQYGYAINTGASNVFGQVISRGGEVAKADGSGYTYNTKQMKDSMAFMKRLYEEGLSRKIAERYGDVDEVVWAQEEPANRGGWTFIFPRLYELFGRRVIRYAGREASASPAVGSLKIHRQEQEELVVQALMGTWDNER